MDKKKKKEEETRKKKEDEHRKKEEKEIEQKRKQEKEQQKDSKSKAFLASFFTLNGKKKHNDMDGYCAMVHESLESTWKISKDKHQNTMDVDGVFPTWKPFEKREGVIYAPIQKVPDLTDKICVEELLQTDKSVADLQIEWRDRFVEVKRLKQQPCPSFLPKYKLKKKRNVTRIVINTIQSRH